MDYKQIITDSWKSTQGDKRVIFWLGFIPALFSTTVGVGYMLYQFFSFKKSFLFNDHDESFIGEVLDVFWTFLKGHNSWIGPLIIFGIIFGICYLVLPTLSKAAAIQTIARKRNGQDAGVSVGIRYGIMSFLTLFEYHLVIKTFAFFSIMTEMSFVLRNLGVNIFQMLIPFFILFLLISLLLTLLFTYADFFIVIDDEGVFDSMKKSAKLVIMHWKHTFFVTLLMIMIGFRIVIQVVFVFLIPALVILITGYLATITLPITGIIVGGIVGGIALILAAYLNGVVDVFSYTVWTFTFLEVSSEKELSAREVFNDDLATEKQSHPGHKNL